MENQAAKIIDGVQRIKLLTAVDVCLDVADKFLDINTLSLKGYFAGVTEFVSETFLFVSRLPADWIETAPIADDRLQLRLNVADRRVIRELLDEVTQEPIARQAKAEIFADYSTHDKSAARRAIGTGNYDLYPHSFSKGTNFRIPSVQS
jgi:hypothetical protein